MGAGASTGETANYSVGAFEAKREQPLSPSERQRLEDFVGQHQHDAGSLEDIQSRLERLDLGRSEMHRTEREYCLWVAKKVAVEITQAALRDAVAHTRAMQLASYQSKCAEPEAVDGSSTTAETKTTEAECPAVSSKSQ